MSVPGKLEATIKIDELPTPETVENGWQHFTIDCDGKEVSVTVKPKMWKKLTSAVEQYPFVGCSGTRSNRRTDADRICVNQSQYPSL